MQNSFERVWIGCDIAKDSHQAVHTLMDGIGKILDAQHISYVQDANPHMTVGYYTHISKQQLADIFFAVYQIKEKYKNISLIQPEEPYDNTLHKITYRKSFVDNELYLVLQPHNPDPIFLDMMFQKNISPHISLAKISTEPAIIQQLLPLIKSSRDEALRISPITVDLKKIHVHF